MEKVAVGGTEQNQLARLLRELGAVWRGLRLFDENSASARSKVNILREGLSDALTLLEPRTTPCLRAGFCRNPHTSILH